MRFDRVDLAFVVGLLLAVVGAWLLWGVGTALLLVAAVLVGTAVVAARQRSGGHGRTSND